MHHRYLYDKRVELTPLGRTIPLGAFLAFKDYGDYVKLTKKFLQQTFNMRDTRWIKHYTYLRHIKPSEQLT